MGKQSQLLLQPTEVELGLQVGVEFDNMIQPITHRMGLTIWDILIQIIAIARKVLGIMLKVHKCWSLPTLSTLLFCPVYLIVTACEIKGKLF